MHQQEGFEMLEEQPAVHLPSMSESILTEDLNMYTEFMAATELFGVRKQNRLACFMLHQATEFGLMKMGIRCL